MKQTRVVVAMSGGVDSSVAAALLLNQGYEVVGMTMCFNLPDAATEKPSCCGMQGIHDAQRVAALLGIKHYVVRMQQVFQKAVIADFCREYLAGRTPNPCVRCNQLVKFDGLMQKAFGLGAQYLATGHYAQISKTRYYALKKAKDLKKDQSYFLYRLNQDQLAHTLFPLGNITKEKVRALAKTYQLPVAQKPDSQEICFLPDNNYRRYLKERFPRQLIAGPILDTEGRRIGTHQGIAFYTIGQREGLGIALGFPAHITCIDAQANTIVVGRREEAMRKELALRDVHWISKPARKKVACKVRIRYNHKESPATYDPGASRVTFRNPQFAVTAGQSAVFYRGNEVLGGGIIA